MTYVAGVYKLKKKLGDSNSPIVYFDGETFWLPGWECPMKIGTPDNSFTISENNIEELIWKEPNEP